MTRLADLKLGFPDSTREVRAGFLRYGPQAYGRIRQGCLPQSMDDKWAFFWEAHRLLICRSWTGCVIWDCRFVPEGEGAVLQEVLVDDGLCARHELEDLGAAWFLIGWKLAGDLSWDDLEGSPAEPVPEALESLFHDWGSLMRRRVEAASKAFPPFPRTLEEGMAYFRGLLEEHPGSPGILDRVACLCQETGRFSEAEQAWTAVAGSSQRCRPLVWRSWARSGLGRRQEAVEDLWAALARCSDRDELDRFRWELRDRLRASCQDLPWQCFDSARLFRKDAPQGDLPLADDSFLRGLFLLAAGDRDGAAEEFGRWVGEDAKRYRAFAEFLKREEGSVGPGAPAGPQPLALGALLRFIGSKAFEEA